jgi:xanthosine phosphorylase
MIAPGDLPAEAAMTIRDRAPALQPRLGLVLGSGLGAAAARIDASLSLDYGELPGFPRPTVAGHAGKLIAGKLGGLEVVCLQGRAHLYEGGAIEALRVPIRTLQRLGCQAVLLTAAAGSLRPHIGAGSIMALTDHLNLSGTSPLVGPNDANYGPRFPALDGAYDGQLRARLKSAAARCGVPLHEGVYAGWLGPQFETPAEIRMLAVLGADSVGMSLVTEAIVARHCGLKLAALAIITNLAAGLSAESLTHEGTVREAAAAAERLTALIEEFCRDMAAH